jgi:ribulose-phosphate 3-epimerase
MIVSPSILSADFANLARDIEMINNSDADWLHLDLMDGVFVPNISFGFPIMKAVQKHCTKPIDAHLMIVNPQNYISQVRDCGAAIMNVHYETCTHLHRTIQAIKAAGMKAAVTLNPATPVSMLEDIINDLDMVLIMSVNPGFSGQAFIESSIAKIERARRLINDSGSKAIIQVDGGINIETAPRVADAGADSVVAGNAIFKADKPEDVITFMHKL